LIFLIQALAGEALGTFLLVFTIAALTAVNEGTPGGIGLLSFAMAASFCVTVIILTIGHTSGAHINPSITVGFAAAGRFPWSQVPFYMVSQITGSVLAILAAKWVYSFPESDFAVTQPRSGPWQSLVLETAMSFVVMFLACILSNNTSQSGNAAAMAVPAAIGLSVMVAGPISGGSLNPARSLGPAIVSRNFKAIWIYIAGPFLGCVTAGIAHSPVLEGKEDSQNSM
ncbi:hypothetical protein SELMODRAFT_92918, partial [Selaginella moellendorffii]